MAKRVKRQRSLRMVLAQYLVGTLLACIAAACLWAMALVSLLNTGIWLPASAMETQTQQAIREISTTGVFPENGQALPELCRWALLENDRIDADVLATNMDSRHAAALQKAWSIGQTAILADDEEHYLQYGYVGAYPQYYSGCQLEDGTAAVFQYDFAMRYADPAMRSLPDIQQLMLVVLVFLLGAAIALNMRCTGRRLRKEVARMVAAATAIREQRLDSIVFDRAGIKEFDAVLSAMQTMGKTLTASLETQWQLEQQRTEQTAALTHDLKTPLAIVQGNAELLGEDATLTKEQHTQVDAINRAALRAQFYLEALRTVGGPDPAKKMVDAAAFVEAIAQTGRALCVPAGIHFIVENRLDGVFWACETQLARAIENLLENASRHTPKGGTVQLTTQRTATLLRFAVEDTGPGFSAEALQQAGRFLYTEDAARQTDGHWGMGLYFARTVAERHGGLLTLENAASGARVLLTVLLQS